MRIPQVDLCRQYEAIGAELEEAARRVLRSGRYILGPEVLAFEREAAAALGAAHAVGVSSGTDALLAVLAALDVGPGDEVVVPAYTFFATAGSVARLGAVPVFADVDPESLLLVPETLEAALSPRTKAVVAVHLFGRCADVPALERVLAARGIPLVEDAAQAFGARLRGRPAGTLGRAACFSFFPAKNLGALGDGGLVTTSDAALAARVERLRNHGQGAAYEHMEVGGNFRLDELQAAFLRVKLPHVEAWTEARRAAAARYRALLAELDPAGRIRPLPDDPDRHAYHQFVVRVPAERRDACLAALARAGIGANVYYRLPLHRQPCFARFARGPLPQAERAAAEALALPMFPELTAAEQREVVATLVQGLENSR